MAKFNLQWKVEKEKAFVKISGSLDEDALFANNDLSGVKNLAVDFSEVDSINSCGVREWVKWLKAVPAEINMTYQNCPTIMVDQINMVAGLMRKGMKIHSFFTPYYCDNCKIQTKVLYQAGKDFVGAKVTAPHNIKCSKCQGSTEMDVIESNYFRFLQWQD